MSTTERDFYDVAMEEAGLCVSAGAAAAGYWPPVSDADAARLAEAVADPAYYNTAMAEVGLVITAGNVTATVNPDHRIQPSWEEINRLPRWARVAYAARCARRIQPYYQWTRPTVDKEDLAAIERAIQLAEVSAAESTASYATAAFDTARSVERLDTRVANIANDVAHVAAATADAAAYATSSDVYTAAYKADHAVGKAFQSLLYITTLGTVHQLIRPAIDLHHLITMAKKEGWTDDTPVPPSVFGPMWDGLPPDWWTEDVLTRFPNKDEPIGNGAEKGTRPAGELASQS